MIIIKLLNSLLLIENIFGIYRDFSNRKNITKYFISAYIIVQILFHTIAVSRHLYLLLGEDGFDYSSLNYTRCFIAASAFLIYVTSIVTSISNSQAFVSYYESTSRVSEWFKNDKKLIASVKKIYWIGLTHIVLSTAFTILNTVDISNNFSLTNASAYLPLISQTLMRLIMKYQHLTFFVVAMIVVQLCKSLNSLVSAVQERVERCDVSSDEQRDITRKQIQEWFVLYQDLASCCENISLTVVRQVGHVITNCTSIYLIL